MLNVTLIAVGSCKERYLVDACREYQKRLGALCKLQLVEVDEYRLPDNPSASQIQKGIEEEGRRIDAKIPAGSALLTLCIEGKLLSSEALAATLDEWTTQGTSSVTLVIGGSYGLWEPLKQRSRLRLSLSPMTFPHQLARVLVLEQLYRALGINAHLKYHK